MLFFFVTPKFCITIVVSFSWQLKWPQEKQKTMLMQNSGWQTKSITVCYGIFWSCQESGRVQISVSFGRGKDFGLRNLADPPFECHFTEVIFPNNIWWLLRSPAHPHAFIFQANLSGPPSESFQSFQWSPLLGSQLRLIGPFVLSKIKWSP